MATVTKQEELEREARWFAEEYRPIAGGQYDGSMVSPGYGDPGLNPFDYFPQSALTDIVRRELETAWESVPDMGDQIAPLKPVFDRQIRRDVAEIAPFGIGQFRAPDASPKIFNPKINFTEELTELLLLDEMTEIKEDLWLRMQSPVAAIRARAGVDLATLGRLMQIRNERLTEVMRWQMFKGNPVIVNYDSGQQIQINYSYPSSHKVSSAVPWTDRVNSTPIDDMRSVQQIIANDIGVWGSRFHMNSQTFSYLQRSNQPRGYLTQTDRNVFLPTVEDITTLLWGGAGTPSDATAGKSIEEPQIIVSNAGYRAESTTAPDPVYGYARGQTSMTTYLLNGEILVTTPYTFEGENIADVADGMVALSQSFNSLRWAQGPQSEIIIAHDSKTTFLRQGSARIPRLRRPQAFALLKAF